MNKKKTFILTAIIIFSLPLFFVGVVSLRDSARASAFSAVFGGRNRNGR